MSSKKKSPSAGRLRGFSKHHIGISIVKILAYVGNVNPKCRQCNKNLDLSTCSGLADIPAHLQSVAMCDQCYSEIEEAEFIRALRKAV